MTINNQKWYSVREVWEEKLIPFGQTEYKIKQFIKRKMLRGNVMGYGEGKRYYVKGSEIIKFIAKWENGFSFIKKKGV